MDESRIKKRYKELKLMGRRWIVGLVIVAFLFQVLPEMLLPGSMHVQAASITDLILNSFVQRNLGEAYNYEMINSGLIEDAIREAHAQGAPWSDVRMQYVLTLLGDTIADLNTDEDGLPYTSNPWTEESPLSEGSPFSPGVDLNGNAMNLEYTLGQLVVDYVRSIETTAIRFEDADIMEMYDQLAGGDDGDPFIDYEALVQKMKSAASAGSTGSYADQDALDAIDTSKMSTYEE